MKNKILLAILAVALVLGMTACGGGGGDYVPKFEETSGRLTITNIDSKYESYYVLGKGNDRNYNYSFDAGDDFSFVADDNLPGNFTRVDTGGKIVNGEVTLKVWKTGNYYYDGINDFYNYIGNDKNAPFDFYIFNKPTITAKDWENKTYKAETKAYRGEPVSFTDGIGTFDATNRIADY